MGRDAEGQARPPELSRRLLRWAVGRAEAPAVEGELGEAFAARERRDGSSAARRWYRLQVAGFLVRVPWTRVTRASAKREVGMGWLGEVSGDVRWAVRGIRKRPSFTAVVVATLALGIGSNSAIFTLLSAHFFEPLPYDRPDELVLIWEAERATGEVMTVAPANYFAWKETLRSVDAVAAFNVSVVTLSGDAAAERVTASVVTPEFFDVLGARPALGTTFSPDAAREAAGALVVLSHGLWMGRYGGDPGIVGRDIRIDGRPHTVVGVMPRAFRQPERQLRWQGAQLWRPLLLDDQREEFGRYLRTVARIAPGATVERARAEIVALAGRRAEEYPEENGAWTVSVRTIDDFLLGDARPVLFMLLGAGAAVLLIVCANVANLTLARGQERQREFAVRAALGSGGRRLLRQVLVESVTLAALGALVGTAVVYAADGMLQSLQERYFSALVDVSVDGRVIAATGLLTLAAGVLFSLPLARTAARRGLRDALGEGGRGGPGRSMARLRNALIVGQVALATTLLVVSALLARSFDALVSVPPGFDPSDRFTFTLSAPRATYADREALAGYFTEVWQAVAAVPGVTAFAMTSDLPFTSENRWTVFGREGEPLDPSTAPRTDYHVVLPEYFSTMGIPVIAGRVFDERWDPVEQPPIVVNQRMASILAPDGDVLGRGVVIDAGDTAVVLRVVGVVGDELDDGYAGAAESIFYMPWGASPNRAMSLIVHVRDDAAAVMDRVRRAVGGIDPDIPLAGLRSMEAMMAETAARPRAASRIGATFALLALMVAAAGIYGVLSYSVQSRTREIGIRAALGADRRRLVSMVLGHSSRLLAAGLVLGLLGALAAGGALSGMLFGVRAWDPPSLLAAVLLLGAVGTLAAWIPARRAVRIDPKEALRAE